MLKKTTGSIQMTILTRRALVAFSLLYFAPTAGGARCSNTDSVGSNNPAGDSTNSDSGTGRQYVATGSVSTVGCCGVVDSWTVYVQNTGTVDLQIWRDTGTGTYQLAGTSQFTYASNGYDTTETLTSANYISVQSGDHIGWYSSGSEVIPYKTNGGSTSSGTYADTNTLVTPGNTISAPGSTYSNRKYGVQAHLGPGNSPTFSNLGVTVTVPCHTATSGDLVYTVTAADADVGDTLTTTLSSVSPSTHFALDSATGQVTLTTSSPSITTYTLSFSVSDACSTSSGSLTVVVSNTAPYFSNLPATASVGCFASIGTGVFTVVPTDDDGVTDTTTMSLSSVTPSAHFAFDAATGAVTVSSSSLTIGTYTMTFSVTDLCGQSSTDTLTITVTNNNPYFTNLDGSISVGCYTPVGTLVFTVTSADSDTVSGDSVTTALNSITPSAHFDFDAITGGVTVLSPALVVGIYVMTFIVTDSSGQSATNTLTITVTDATPYFSNLDAIITSASSVTSRDVLYTVTSLDADSGSGDSVSTTLDSVTPFPHLTFDVSSGNVSVSSTAVVTDYVLTFTATDACGQSSTNTLTVSFYNNAPVIASLPTTVDVREDETSSLLLHTVAVSDADGHAITCVISDTVPASAPFLMKFINNGAGLDNGIYLSPNAGLDYSVVNTYTLTVNCTDGYDNDVDTLYVYIVANGMPLISNLQNSTSVSTKTVVSSEVFVVLTSDLESNQLSFSLNCTNTVTCPFAVYSTGSILLSQTLLGTTTLAYELDITVSDSYSTSATHRLTVFVSDLNVAPVLTNLPQTIQVSEDTTPGSSLFLVSVYDADGDVSFTFDVLTNPTTGAAKFVLNVATRTVSLATTQSLDYETTTEYTLNVSVSDGTLTSPFAVLTLQVADVNEPPALLQTHYYIARDEGTAGTSFNLPSIQASDPDPGDALTFSFGSGSNLACGLLSINCSTGVLGYASDYDVDNGNLTSYFSCVIKVQDTGGLAATATTTVSISDVNDNQPLFTTPKNIIVTVTKSTAVGTLLTVVSVSDNDLTAANRQLSFTLTQAEYYFALTSSGEVTLAGDLSLVQAGVMFNATITTAIKSGSLFCSSYSPAFVVCFVHCRSRQIRFSPSAQMANANTKYI